jgi:hypothetical protein
MQADRRRLAYKKEGKMFNVVAIPTCDTDLNQEEIIIIDARTMKVEDVIVSKGVSEADYKKWSYILK